MQDCQYSSPHEKLKTGWSGNRALLGPRNNNQSSTETRFALTHLSALSMAMATSSGFVLDRSEDKPRVKLLPEWLSRIKPVNNEVRSTLCGAEICVSLTLSPIPEGMDPSLFEDIGLHHPPDPC
jgi:hypothetical protein